MSLIVNGSKLQHFPFLRLPLKLRIQIYNYVLVAHSPTEIHEASRRRRSSVSRGVPVERPGRLSAVLRTCRQIRTEAAPLYFGKNQFVIPWGFPNLGCRWLECLTPEHRNALRDVRFCYGDGAFWTIYDARTALCSLKLMLERSGIQKDLSKAKLWVPVCEFSVHTWTELKDRNDAQWVGMNETMNFCEEKKESCKI